MDLFFESDSALLFLEELFPGAVSELDEAVDPLYFCVISIALLLLLDEDIFILEVVIVVGVVEFVHLM